MKKTYFALLTTLYLCSTHVAIAQDAILEKIEYPLSLKDSIVLALKHNLDLEIERYQPQISQVQLQQIKDSFGLSLGMDSTLTQSISPSAQSFISGASILSNFRQNYNFFLKQNFFTGGNLQIQFKNQVNDSNSSRVDLNPAITPQLALNFNQSLLKNFLNGFRRISVGHNTSVAANYLLKSRAIDIVSQVQDSYWTLVLSRENLKVLKKSIALTEDLLKINEEKQKAGFLAKIDVLTTQARIAAKEENLLQAKRTLQNQEDRLKKLLNPDGKAGIDWDTPIRLIEEPDFYQMNVDEESSLKKAYKFRPDYQALLLEIENTKLNLDIASQNRLPKLDLTSSAGLESLNQSYNEAVSQLFNFKTYFWNVGLAFEIPVIGNQAHSNYLESNLKNEQQQKKLDNKKQSIVSEVRQSVRNVNINMQRVKANRLAKKLTEEQLKAETEKLNLGLSSNFQVLQYQNDFENASLNEVKAIIDFIKSVNDLYATEGILLETYNLSWE